MRHTVICKPMVAQICAVLVICFIYWYISAYMESVNRVRSIHIYIYIYIHTHIYVDLHGISKQSFFDPCTVNKQCTKLNEQNAQYCSLDIYITIPHWILVKYVSCLRDTAHQDPIHVYTYSTKNCLHFNYLTILYHSICA